MGERERRIFTEDFEREAVRLTQTRGRTGGTRHGHSAPMTFKSPSAPPAGRFAGNLLDGCADLVVQVGNQLVVLPRRSKIAHELLQFAGKRRRCIYQIFKLGSCQFAVASVSGHGTGLCSGQPHHPDIMIDSMRFGNRCRGRQSRHSLEAEQSRRYPAFALRLRPAPR
jgi:hypothetical protein